MAALKSTKEEEEEEEWVSLGVPPEELRPSVTLVNGQAFSWKPFGLDTWVGVIGDLVVAIRETSTDSLAKPLNATFNIEEQQQQQQQQQADNPVKSEPKGRDKAQGKVSRGLPSSRKATKQSNDEEILLRVPSAHDHQQRTSISLVDFRTTLQHYFQLDTPLAPLYQAWSNDETFREVAAHRFKGVRIIRQDPVECLLSFICSSNNNIARITQMLDKFRRTYGTFLFKMQIKDKTEEFFQFPTLEQLKTVKEDDLRSLGFGYRAKFIVSSIDLLDKKGVSWLEALRKEASSKVRDSLMLFQGVGRKVADCIALFSLDVTDSIPVDTHVWQITCRYYHPNLTKAKTLTNEIYREIGELYRSKFGKYCGWAHSVLFTSDLSSFAKYTPPHDGSHGPKNVSSKALDVHTPSQQVVVNLKKKRAEDPAPLASKSKRMKSSKEKKT